MTKIMMDRHRCAGKKEGEGGGYAPLRCPRYFQDDTFAKDIRELDSTFFRSERERKIKISVIHWWTQ